MRRVSDPTRNGNPYTARLPWPDTWQAHPDYDLIRARLTDVIEQCRANNEHIEAYIAHLNERFPS